MHVQENDQAREHLGIRTINFFFHDNKWRYSKDRAQLYKFIYLFSYYYFMLLLYHFR